MKDKANVFGIMNEGENEVQAEQIPLGRGLRENLGETDLLRLRKYSWRFTNRD